MSRKTRFGLILFAGIAVFAVLYRWGVESAFHLRFEVAAQMVDKCRAQHGISVAQVRHQIAEGRFIREVVNDAHVTGPMAPFYRCLHADSTFDAGFFSSYARRKGTAPWAPPFK